MGEWHLNGEPCNEIPIDSRGLQYGDGIFETVAVRDGKPRLWPLHVARLFTACDRLGLERPDAGPLRAFIERADKAYATAKIVVAAKGGKRGYARASSQTDVLMRVYDANPLPVAYFRDGVDVMICETTLATGSAIAGLKTLNRLEQVLARNELVSAGRFEGLTRDADGRLICGTMSNLFAVKDGTIITPKLNRCGVEGVMRRHIIETLSAGMRPVEIADIESLDGLEEVFLSNSQFGVLPVRACGDRVWPVGPVTCEVIESLAVNGVQEPSR